MRKKLVPGRSTAVTPERARASMPGGETAMRWSAERAPSSAASSAPPESANSSAWRRGARQWRTPASRTRRDSAAGKNPPPQKTAPEAGQPGLGRGRDDLVADQVDPAPAVLPIFRRKLVSGQQGGHQVHRMPFG